MKHPKCANDSLTRYDLLTQTITHLEFGQAIPAAMSFAKYIASSSTVADGVTKQLAAEIISVAEGKTFQT